MKSVSEFANFTLTNGLKQKAALAAEGKTAEEIQQSLGEAFKLEGDKLAYFMNALGVAEQNAENLKRVLIMSLSEGERVPAKATKIDELFFVPEFHVDAKRASPKKDDRKGGRGGRSGKGSKGGPKESPWGLSPEEKAAKTGKGAGAKPKPH